MLDCGSINALRFPIDIYENGNVFISLAEGKEKAERIERKGEERGRGAIERSISGSVIVAAAQRWWQVCLLPALFVCLPRACLSCIALLEGDCVCVSVCVRCVCVCPLAAKNETQNECRKVKKKSFSLFSLGSFPITLP